MCGAALAAAAAAEAIHILTLSITLLLSTHNLKCLGGVDLHLLRALWKRSESFWHFREHLLWRVLEGPCNISLEAAGMRKGNS